MEEFLKNFDLLPKDAIAIPLMAVVFAIFWKLLGQVVIARHLALYEARERNSSGASSGAEENFSTATKLEADFESQLLAERTSITKSLEPKLVAARAEATKIIESAEAEASALIETTRAEIAQEEGRLVGVIEKEADALANSISERVLA